MYSSSLRNIWMSFKVLDNLSPMKISIRFSSTVNKNIFEAKEKKIFSKNCSRGVQEFFVKIFVSWL